MTGTTAGTSTTGTAGTSTAGTVVRAVHAMAGASDAEFAAVFHPEAVNHEALAEPAACRARGPAGFRATSAWLTTAFADLAFEVQEVVEQGDVVVVLALMSGRHTGDFVVRNDDGGIERAFAPTGRRFSVAQSHHFRVRDGLVVEHRAVRDDQGMARQLGWVPPSPAYLLRCALATSRARRRGAAGG
ncbi:ester cyclase [Kineococcus gynurae]|uniref:Ester cyclase n=1 Tax=Kineococcus gynurae TaxID=452979 RepID=A0ABV5LTZ7_9ACTN